MNYAYSNTNMVIMELKTCKRKQIDIYIRNDRMVTQEKDTNHENRIKVT